MIDKGISLLSISGAVLCVVGVGYASLSLRWRARSHGLPFPPGPKGLPLIGNIFNFPTTWAWVEFQRLGAEYGDVLYFRVLGQSILVLNNATAIAEYLDKNTVNTSDRARSITLMVELTGNTHNVGLMPYGQRWRDHRRVLWQYFRSDAARAQQPTQRAVAHIFLEKLLTSPSKLEKHIRYAFAGSALHVTYGIDYTSDVGDKYSEAMSTAIVSVSEGLVPGRFMVQYFPFLRYVPSWFPGGGFQKQFAQWRGDNHKAITMPYEYACVEMHCDKDVQDSMVGQHIAHLIRTGGVSPQDEELLKNASAIAFEAGADTTLSTVKGALLALSLHPEVIKRAQEELDTVVGPNRLPDFDDEPSLLYVKAVIMEVARWYNVLPLGAAHGTIDDDEWRGWFIPGGTLILPNVWACMHDPQMFPEPLEFRPERFIKGDAIDTTLVDPTVFMFGYGRRVCVGRHFARAGLFITLASLLHVFDLSAPLDERGEPIKIEPRFTDGALS
ncbi:O-methylsterigmatocystin oxidoreductase [Epithele typhae]|uniref:O-methylsterigmatocystin oxidoreductase n=1 Tax=Epithele typhae TaxID=378194 RepID=UPI0020072C00|nr:O-methylsterigmatocystin oxidoreductase [Epithele typhae]KAH9929106.1 O-methylsterigmatocystin oxidoreductase [Epithele typhae]